MKSICTTILTTAISILSAVTLSCSGPKTEPDLREYSDKYIYYCRKGLFDSLAADAGKVFAARSPETDRRLVLLSGLHSAQAAIFLDNYPKASAYLDTLSGFDDWDSYPDLKAMLDGIRASYEIKAGFDYPSALVHLTDALNYYREEGNALNTCNALNNISMIYFFRRDTVGLRYARQALSISSEHPNDPYMMCTADVVMAMMLLVKGDYENAEKHAISAKGIADREGYSLVYPRIYMVMGDAALQRGDIATAAGLLEEGFQAAVNTDPDFYFELALPYSSVLITSGRYRQAGQFLTQTLETVERNNNIRYKSRLLEQLSILYEAEGNIPEAYRCYKNSVASRDSIMNVDKETSFNNLLDLYEKASLQNIIRQKQYDMYLTILICIISILAGGFFFYRYRQQSRLNKELVQRNQEYLKRSEMLRKYLEPETGTGKESAEDELFGKLEKLMRKDRIYRSNDISLEKLAALLGTNRTYISRVINKCANKSFWGYVNMYRISEATEMLSDLDNDIQIKNIYETLGYNSAASFFRVFRDEIGLSPSKYRDEIRRMNSKK